MKDKKWKSEISTLVAVCCHNVPDNTHKTNNGLKVLRCMP